MRRSLLGSSHILTAAFGALAVLASAAHAELGGRLDTIDGDSVHLHARRASAPEATHSSHTLTLGNGGTVHEYANGDGLVFAISWSGPGRPDLRRLLGGNFDAFQSRTSAHRGRMMLRHVDVAQSALVVHSSGHPGMFRGIAYLPHLVPQGFSLDALQ